MLLTLTQPVGKLYEYTMSKPAAFPQEMTKGANCHNCAQPNWSYVRFLERCGRDDDGYSLEKHAEAVASNARGGSLHDSSQSFRAQTPLMMGGMTDSALDQAQKLLAPMGIVPLRAGGSGALTSDEDQHHYWTRGDNGGWL